MKQVFSRFLIFSISFWMMGLGPLSSQPSDFEIVKQFAPQVFFHPDELYFPSAVEFALNNMSLMHETSKRQKKSLGPLDITTKKRQAEVVADPPLNPTLLEGKDDTYFLQFNGKGSISTVKTYYRGEPLSGGNSSAPVYARLYKIDPNNYAIMYAFFYPYNGPLSIVSVGDKGLVGYHEGDWEHIEVFIQKEGDQWKLLSVHFARHGREAGEHLTADQFEIYQQTHPVVLAALYGHGAYPSHVKGITQHLDRVGKGTSHWDTWNNIVMINDSTPWNNSQVRFGSTQSLTNSSPQAPKNQSWWVELTKYRPPQVKSSLSAIDQAPEIYRIENIDPVSKTPQEYSKDISSQYRQVCFQLVRQGTTVPDKSVNFSIMEHKRLRKDEKIYDGNKCQAIVNPRMKGYYVAFPKGYSSNQKYTLIIKGLT